MGILGGRAPGASLEMRASLSTFGSKARREVGAWLLIAGVLPLALLMSIPFAWMYISSLKTPAEILSRELTWFPRTLYTNNFVEVWERSTILRGYANSVVVSAASVSLSVLTSALCGYLFAKKQFWGKAYLFIFILSTLMVPYFAIFIPSYFVYAKLLGLKDTYIGLILPHLFTPFGILLTRQYLHSIPNELVDSATVDGAGDWRIFWYIILPLSKSVLAAIAILQFLASFNEFLWPLVMIDKRDMYTLPLVLRFVTAAEYQNRGRILAAAVIALTPIVIFFLVFQRHIVRGISLTGLKA